VQLGFKVTSKDANVSEFRKSFSWVLPFFIYYLLAASAMGFGVLTLLDRYYSATSSETPSTVANTISMVWVSFIM